MPKYFQSFTRKKVDIFSTFEKSLSSKVTNKLHPIDKHKDQCETCKNSKLSLISFIRMTLQSYTYHIIKLVDMNVVLSGTLQSLFKPPII